MALPALSLTWKTRGNMPAPNSTDAPNIHKSFLHCFLFGMLGEDVGGTVGAEGAPTSSWTLYGSCDGVNGAMDGAGGTNRLGAANAYDGTKWVCARGGYATDARSWFALHNATLGLYLIVEWMSTNNIANQYFVHVTVCSAAPTAGGAAGNEKVVAGGTTFVATWYQHNDSAPTGTHYGTLSMDAQGYFFFAWHKPGHTHPTRGGLALLPTEGAATCSPWVFFGGVSASTSQGGFDVGTYGLASVAAGVGYPLRGPNGHGTGAVTGGMVYFDAAGNDTVQSAAYGGSVNPYTGEIEPLPAIWQVGTTDHRHKVTIVDLLVVGDGLTGTTYPASGNPTRAVFDNILVPCSVAPMV